MNKKKIDVSKIPAKISAFYKKTDKKQWLMVIIPILFYILSGVSNAMIIQLKSDYFNDSMYINGDGLVDNDIRVEYAITTSEIKSDNIRDPTSPLLRDGFLYVSVNITKDHVSLNNELTIQGEIILKNAPYKTAYTKHWISNWDEYSADFWEEKCDLVFNYKPKYDLCEAKVPISKIRELRGYYVEINFTSTELIQPNFNLAGGTWDLTIFPIGYDALTFIIISFGLTQLLYFLIKRPLEMKKSIKELVGLYHAKENELKDEKIDEILQKHSIILKKLDKRREEE